MTIPITVFVVLRWDYEGWQMYPVDVNYIAFRKYKMAEKYLQEKGFKKNEYAEFFNHSTKQQAKICTVKIVGRDFQKYLDFEAAFKRQKRNKISHDRIKIKEVYRK